MLGISTISCVKSKYRFAAIYYLPPPHVFSLARGRKVGGRGVEGGVLMSFQNRQKRGECKIFVLRGG